MSCRQHASFSTKPEVAQAIITLNCPEARNAINREIAECLEAAVD
jgi:enoyl-CoA hydratase/carnithine racemase